MLLVGGVGLDRQRAPPQPVGEGAGGRALGVDLPQPARHQAAAVAAAHPAAAHPERPSVGSAGRDLEGDGATPGRGDRDVGFVFPLAMRDDVILVQFLVIALVGFGDIYI